MAHCDKNDTPIDLGDVVTLGANGPRMTVEYLWSQGTVGCVWFDKDDELHREDFKPSLLVVEKSV